SDQSRIGKLIKDKFGIVFDYNVYSGDMKVKQLLMLSSRDYNEIQSMTQDDIVTSYVNGSTLLSLDKYVEYLPDFYIRFENEIKRWRVVGRGTLYKWETDRPGCFYDVTQNNIAIRSDVLEKNNWIFPTELAGWQSFLKRFTYEFNSKNSEAPILGMVMPFGDSYGIEHLAASFIEKNGGYLIAGANTCIFNLNTGRYEEMLTHEKVKESYRFFNHLYQDGTLDKECFTDTAESCIKKMKEGRALSSLLSGNELQKINNTLSQTGNENKQFCTLPLNQSTKNNTPPAINSSSYYSFGVTDKCKEPKRVFEMLNWMCTDEGQIALQSGIEAVHWDWQEDKRVPLQPLIDSYANEFCNKKEGINAFQFAPIVNSVDSLGQPFDLMKMTEYQNQYGTTKRQRYVYEKMGVDIPSSGISISSINSDTNVSLIQNIMIDPPTSYGQLERTVKELMGQYVPQLICATSDERFEEIYQQMIASYSKMKYSRVVDEYNRLLNLKQNIVLEY
ncbi:MAG: hypothetical protein RR444_06590, partial [Oscillospiraceae bacterium]